MEMVMRFVLSEMLGVPLSAVTILESGEISVFQGSDDELSWEDDAWVAPENRMVTGAEDEAPGSSTMTSNALRAGGRKMASSATTATTSRTVWRSSLSGEEITGSFADSASSRHHHAHSSFSFDTSQIMKHLPSLLSNMFRRDSDSTSSSNSESYDVSGAAANSVVATLSDWSERLLANQEFYSVIVSSRLKINMIFFPEFEGDANLLFEYLSERLIAEVNAGNFTALLRETADTMGARDLLTVTIDEVRYSAFEAVLPFYLPVYDNNTLKDSEVGLIAAAIGVAFFCCFAFLLFGHRKREDNKKAQEKAKYEAEEAELSDEADSDSEDSEDEVEEDTFGGFDGGNTLDQSIEAKLSQKAQLKPAREQDAIRGIVPLGYHSSDEEDSSDEEAKSEAKATPFGASMKAFAFASKLRGKAVGTKKKKNKAHRQAERDRKAAAREAAAQAERDRIAAIEAAKQAEIDRIAAIAAAKEAAIQLKIKEEREMIEQQQRGSLGIVRGHRKASVDTIERSYKEGMAVGGVGGIRAGLSRSERTYQLKKSPVKNTRRSVIANGGVGSSDNNRLYSGTSDDNLSDCESMKQQPTADDTNPAKQQLQSAGHFSPMALASNQSAAAAWNKEFNMSPYPNAHSNNSLRPLTADDEESILETYSHAGKLLTHADPKDTIVVHHSADEIDYVDIYDDDASREFGMESPHTLSVLPKTGEGSNAQIVLLNDDDDDDQSTNMADANVEVAVDAEDAAAIARGTTAAAAAAGDNGHDADVDTDNDAVGSLSESYAKPNTADKSVSDKFYSGKGGRSPANNRSGNPFKMVDTSSEIDPHINRSPAKRRGSSFGTAFDETVSPHMKEAAKKAQISPSPSPSSSSSIKKNSTRVSPTRKSLSVSKKDTATHTSPAVVAAATGTATDADNSSNAVSNATDSASTHSHRPIPVHRHSAAQEAAIAAVEAASTEQKPSYKKPLVVQVSSPYSNKQQQQQQRDTVPGDISVNSEDDIVGPIMSPLMSKTPGGSMSKAPVTPAAQSLAERDDSQAHINNVTFASQRDDSSTGTVTAPPPPIAAAAATSSSSSTPSPNSGKSNSRGTKNEWQSAKKSSRPADATTTAADEETREDEDIVVQSFSAAPTPKAADASDTNEKAGSSSSSSTPSQEIMKLNGSLTGGLHLRHSPPSRVMAAEATTTTKGGAAAAAADGDGEGDGDTKTLGTSGTLRSGASAVQSLTLRPRNASKKMRNSLTLNAQQQPLSKPPSGSAAAFAAAEKALNDAELLHQRQQQPLFLHPPPRQSGSFRDDASINSDITSFTFNNMDYPQQQTDAVDDLSTPKRFGSSTVDFATEAAAATANADTAAPVDFSATTGSSGRSGRPSGVGRRARSRQPLQINVMMQSQGQSQGQISGGSAGSQHKATIFGGDNADDAV